ENQTYLSFTLKSETIREIYSTMRHRIIDVKVLLPNQIAKEKVHMDLIEKKKKRKKELFV
ncbi:MAG: hypothetical protein QXK85_03820, partial [Thermofilum sp.]